MHIALDARTIYSPTRRGTGKNLIDLYRRLATLRRSWRFTMFHRPFRGDDPFASLANVERQVIDMPGDRWDLWQQLRLPLAARWFGADVLHCPANTAPRRALTPLVVTVHDLIPLEGHGGREPDVRWERNVAAAVRKARRIITPSEYSRGQIAERFGIDADKITVNHWAPDEACRRVTDLRQLRSVRERYALGAAKPYVFGFGAADPRKNTGNILRAWCRVPERLRGECNLLLVGLAEPAMSEMNELSRQLGIVESCRLHGFAPEGDIPALLSGSVMLCYPSLSEGFGLPVLDAFICETCVLTSRTTSLPEVAGDAAELVDPADVDSIAAGITSLLSDFERRQNLIERGRVRLPKFTWEACAARACAALEAAIAPGK